MKTIESIKNEIIKLNNEVNEIWNKKDGNFILESFDKCREIDKLSDEVFEMGYGFKFYWEEEDDCEFSSSVIKIGEEIFISGDILITGNLEIDLRSECDGIGRVLEIAKRYQIEIRFEIFKFK